jgi:hypothetical protein
MFGWSRNSCPEISQNSVKFLAQQRNPFQNSKRGSSELSGNHQLAYPFDPSRIRAKQREHARREGRRRRRNSMEPSKTWVLRSSSSLPLYLRPSSSVLHHILHLYLCGWLHPVQACRPPSNLGMVCHRRTGSRRRCPAGHVRPHREESAGDRHDWYGGQLGRGGQSCEEDGMGRE